MRAVLHVFACPFLLLLLPHLELFPSGTLVWFFFSFLVDSLLETHSYPPPAFPQQERVPVQSVSKVKLPSLECSLLRSPGSHAADGGGVQSKLLEQLTKA